MKRLYFLPCCGDETATYHDRAFSFPFSAGLRKGIRRTSFAGPLPSSLENRRPRLWAKRCAFARNAANYTSRKKGSPAPSVHRTLHRRRFVKRFQKVKKAYKNAAKKGNFLLAGRTGNGRTSNGVPSRKSNGPAREAGLSDEGRAALGRREEMFIRPDSRFRRGGLAALPNGERPRRTAPSTRP